MGMVKQYEVYWVNLDPTVGKEIKKTRPCVIISPDELNRGLATVLVSPLTSNVRHYPFRSVCFIDGKDGSVALDQTRCIDKSRLVNKISELSDKEVEQLKTVLEDMLIK